MDFHTKKPEDFFINCVITSFSSGAFYEAVQKNYSATLIQPYNI
jgi:hypothetical protein